MRNPVFKHIRASVGTARISRAKGNNRIACATGGSVVNFQRLKYYFFFVFLLFASFETGAAIQVIQPSPPPSCSSYVSSHAVDEIGTYYVVGNSGTVVRFLRNNFGGFLGGPPWHSRSCTVNLAGVTTYGYEYRVSLPLSCTTGYFDDSTGTCASACLVDQTRDPVTNVCTTPACPPNTAGQCVPDEQFTLSLHNLGGEVEPSGTAAGAGNSNRTAFARVVNAQTNAPKPVVQVRITVDVNANSGGHDHHDANRPKGKLFSTANQPQCSYPDAAQPHIIVCPTDGNGSAYFTFTAPQPSGTHSFTAACVSPACTNTTTGNVEVKVAGLVPLSSSSRVYKLVGVTNTHALNQYLTPAALDIARKLAIRYNAQFPASPLLRYNDASLPYGGVFDICTGKETTPGCSQGAIPHCQLQANGTYTCSWSKPHKEHRRGTVVDIRANNDTATAIPVANDDGFWDLATDLGANPGDAPHSPNSPTNRHWHVRLLGVNE